ncbi:folate family ECF transporter S component [Vaginisenegalia massiliensis]|uniref:folate family ECF transporter S component n=1 Tax=Vaginisenegalia massiliensis TaxID=2058294 RepID=UPI0013DE18F9|nr:folate family ECF transporter S component [Vaginisenegalia massiliensis]
MNQTGLQQLKNSRVLATVALLIAMDLVLNAFRLRISPTVEINFAFLAVLINAYLFGPAVAGLSAVLGDIIGFIITPSGMFFPGFTLNALVIALIFSYGLYQQKSISWSRLISVFLAKSVVISLILTPLWLKILYGTELFAVPRIIRTLILFPIEVGLAMLVLKVVDRVMANKSFQYR